MKEIKRNDDEGGNAGNKKQQKTNATEQRLANLRSKKRKEIKK